MNISVIGTGYVGAVTGACLAELGHNVICVDVIKQKVDAINAGEAPIFEVGLKDVISKNVGKRLSATSDVKKAIMSSDITFICVGTPSKDDGSTDLTYVKEASADIGHAIAQKNSYHLVIVKSTVPPNTTRSLASIIEKESRKFAGNDFDIAMNPEFLREGNAIQDFMDPDRIVIGVDYEKPIEILRELYSSFKCPFVIVDLKTAEMIKYVSNALLATKISFANEVGNLCKKMNIDVYEVMKGVGFDRRVNPRFLNAGIGFGGSCLPKDVKLLIHIAKTNNIPSDLLNSVIKINENQPLRLIEFAKKRFGSLDNKKITVLGLAFKPNSDDVREAPSLKIISALLNEGANISVFDPAAMGAVRKIFGDKLHYASSLKDALNFSEIIFLLTEWTGFRDPSLYFDKTVFDGRRVFNKKSDDKYEGVCW